MNFNSIFFQDPSFSKGKVNISEPGGKDEDGHLPQMLTCIDTHKENII